MSTVQLNLQPKQMKAYEYLTDDVSSEIFFGGGANSGKTFLGCAMSSLMCLAYPQSITIIAGAEVKKLKDTVVPTMLDVLRKTFEMSMDYDYKYNYQTGRITFKQNDSFILLKDLSKRPSDPNYLYIDGYTPTFAFIDEAPGITKEAKDKFRGRIRYKHSEYGINVPKLLMTGNPAPGWCKDEFYTASVKNDLPEYRKFIQATIYDNKYAGQGEIDNLKSLPPELRKIYLEGVWNFDNDKRSIMGRKQVEDAFNQNIEPDTNDKFMSVDVAGGGKDKTVILVFYGKKLMDYKVIDKNDAEEFVDIVRYMAKNHGIPTSRIVIDASGLGFISGMIKGCYQFVGNKLPMATNRDKKVFRNIKGQSFYKLAEMINNRELDLSILDGIHKERCIEELCAIRRKKLLIDGPLEIEPKDKMKSWFGKSPDYADALAMSMVFQINRYQPIDSLLNVGFDAI